MSEKESKQREKANQVDRVSGAYKRLFATKNGQIVLDDMMRNAGFLEGKYEGDPHEVVFREGVRAHMARTLKMIEFNPKQFREYAERLNKEREHGITY